MADEYYIGKRKRYGKRLKKPQKALLLLGILILALVLLFQAILLPQVRSLCETHVCNRLEALANKKVYEFFKENAYSYTDFILLNYDTDGKVRSASVDTVKLNLLKTTLAMRVLESITTGDVSVSVPVGNLFGLLIFSAKGKDVDITARVAKGLHARFYNTFTSTSFNQTRHAIGFSLDFTATYLLPTGREDLAFSVDIPVGETIIVGDVPDSLTQINRFIEDISELEIDDAVDFGNVLS